MKVMNGSVLCALVKAILFLFVVTANAENLESISEKCDSCHGKNGNSIKPNIPSIGGMSYVYLVSTLQDYQDNTRQSKLMNPYVAGLSRRNLELLAEFYSEQTFYPAKQEFDKNRIDSGKMLHIKYCEKCHEDSGRSVENNNGILAAQWTPYLRTAIDRYLNAQRETASKMKSKLEKLIKQDGQSGIEDLLHYYASLQIHD